MDFDAMPTWKRWTFYLTSLPILFAARALYQNYPNIWTCVLFWIISLPDEPLRLAEMGGRRRILYTGAFIGALGNAVATIANGGHMPVANYAKEPSLWIPLTASAHLPWLCDIYPLGAATASLGDLFIFAALLGLFLNWIAEKTNILTKESVALNKRIPGIGVG